MPASIPIVLGVLAIVTTVLFVRKYGFIDKEPPRVAAADGPFGFPLKGVLRGMRPSRTYPGMWAIRVNRPDGSELAPVYAARDGKVKLVSQVEEPEGGPNPGEKFWRIELSHDNGYETHYGRLIDLDERISEQTSVQRAQQLGWAKAASPVCLVFDIVPPPRRADGAHGRLTFDWTLPPYEIGKPLPE